MTTTPCQGLSPFHCPSHFRCFRCHRRRLRRPRPCRQVCFQLHPGPYTRTRLCRCAEMALHGLPLSKRSNRLCPSGSAFGCWWDHSSRLRGNPPGTPLRRTLDSGPETTSVPSCTSVSLSVLPRVPGSGQKHITLVLSLLSSKIAFSQASNEKMYTWWGWGGGGGGGGGRGRGANIAFRLINP